MKALVFTVLLLFASALPADTRFNPYTNLWEGNICANQWGWTWVQWAPIGSLCYIRFPDGNLIPGYVVNQ